MFSLNNTQSLSVRDYGQNILNGGYRSSKSKSVKDRRYYLNSKYTDKR